ncbi:MAG: cytochrome bc complex cytochrome b subunit [Candidatus Aminicenantaceae bacterium]
MSARKVQAWFEDRLGLSDIFGFLTKKPIPQHKHTIWYYTGSAILLFFVIQVVTGFMLAFYYKPTLEQANASVARIITEVPLGWIMRSIHSWSASFMIALVFIHLLSIWITKAYRKPRELTWMSGVLLLVVSLAFGFTGYLLPWDELSLSATKVGTDIPRAIPVVGQWVTDFLRGGGDVTGDTLTRFFGIHISILPIFAFLLLALHVFLIQKHGISYPLEAEKHKEKVKTIPFWPNFVYREMVVWLLFLGVFLTVAILKPHPLGSPADLMAPAPEGIKPEWYFLFLFQTLKIFPAHVLIVSGETLAVFLMLFFVALFFVLPLIDTKPEERRGRIITYSAYVFILYAVIMSVWSLL